MLVIVLPACSVLPQPTALPSADAPHFELQSGFCLKYHGAHPASTTSALGRVWPTVLSTEQLRLVRTEVTGHPSTVEPTLLPFQRAPGLKEAAP
jgi:hypothetical protein